MGLFVKRKPKETSLDLVYRFTKKLSQSGILREARKRLYRDRNISETKKREKALYREMKIREIEKLKKLGKL
jgi:ribosomal protein S21